jgi:hypothetical protein
MSQSFIYGGIVTADMTDIDRLQRNLKAYLGAPHKRTVLQILNHKGNAMRIDLFKLFWAHRFLKRGKKGNWMRILRRIISDAKGIKVRSHSLQSKWSSLIPDVDKNGKKLSLWQKLVAQEVLRRISGSGVLGVSFLAKRWRKNSTGKTLIDNRTNTLGLAARFEVQDDFVQITGFTPGLEKIARRYGILKEVIRRANADIEKFLSDKISPAFVEALHAR